MRAGAYEATGDAPDIGRLPQPPGKRIEDQARTALKLAGDVHLLFAHQVADARDPEEVRQRIQERLAGVDDCRDVCVIPFKRSRLGCFSMRLRSAWLPAILVAGKSSTSHLDGVESHQAQGTSRGRSRRSFCKGQQGRFKDLPGFVPCSFSASTLMVPSMSFQRETARCRHRGCRRRPAAGGTEPASLSHPRAVPSWISAL